ncbi:MAG: CpXC domain-containing protein [Chloroflexota bacterium]
MRTQITCPNCRRPYTAEVLQIIDVGQTPQLKQLFLSGRLNVAVCPHCGLGGPLHTPLLYHDPAHELFAVYVPVEMGLSQVEQERIIGQLQRQAMDSLPPEQRRGYMFQPQTILSMQTLVEKVLATEGITPEMLARQRKQAELLRTLATASSDVVDILLKERAGEIDETFFAMMSASLEAANQAGDEAQAIGLLNLQAQLYSETPLGRRLERQQVALQRLNQEARKAGGLSPNVLLHHILANQDDERLVEMLAAFGASALTYQFFSLLTTQIDKKKREKDKAAVNRLTELREKLVQIQTEMQKESERLLEKARTTLTALLQAPDPAAALNERWPEIDDTFLYVLESSLAQAKQSRNTALVNALSSIQELIAAEMERDAPPELQLLNGLMEAPSLEAQQQLLNQNRHLVTADLLRIVDAMLTQSTPPALTERMQQIRGLLESSLARA